MKIKKMLVTVVAMTCLLALLLCGCVFEQPQVVEGEKTFTVQVVHADGTVMEKNITTTQNYLAHALIDEGVLTEDGLETGMYLTADGEEASWEKDQAYWSFLINGEMAVKGMNDTPIEEGAVYRLEYTIG